MWETILKFIFEHPLWSGGLFVVFVCIVVFIHDILQKRHAIVHNFPIVGHFRYMLEMIGPELRQYWVANDKEERPFNRHERSWIYASAKGENNAFGFGTTEVFETEGYPIIKHSAFPFPDKKATYPGDDPTAVPCLKVMGTRHNRKRPYRPESIINISAMSFGSLGERAISALNKGAKRANCFHNTGEGGLSPYHKNGADIVWQLGTGYFGARDENNKFSIEKMKQVVAENSIVRAIEIKLSQGAKPGKGGILPGKKVTAEIAAVRGIPVREDCFSPNAHEEFSNVEELIDFIEQIAEATGLPVGIKSAVGEIDFWIQLAAQMVERNQGPDFITIDGAEGGTGAAPLSFSDHVALPFRDAFSRVFPIFQQAGISQDIVWVASGKLGFPEQAIVAFAMGVDVIQIAREAMISIGCIQAQKCHTGFCPAGIATQSRWLQGGVNVEEKAERFASYLRSFRKELLSLAHAAGYEHPAQITGQDIEFYTDVKFIPLAEVLNYECDPSTFTSMEDYTPLS